MKDDSTIKWEHIHFRDLFKLDQIQKLQDDFSRATHVASIITTPDGTPITKASGFTYLCEKLIRKSKIGCENCFKSDAYIGRFNPQGPNIQICMSGGLWDAGAGISIEGHHIANWLIGQVRDKTESNENILGYADIIGADRDEMLEAYMNVPAMEYEHFHAIADLLFNLANKLSTIAFDNLQLKKLVLEKTTLAKNLSESQKRFKTLVETTSDFIWELDPQAIFTYISPSIKALLGYEPDELLGTSSFNLMPPSEAERMNKEFEKYVEKQLPFRNLSNINIHKDGHFVHLESNGDPFYDEKGNFMGYRGSDRDITDRLKLEERVFRTKKLESIGLLAGGVAHDFNNMLTEILGFTDLLQDLLPKEAEYQLYLQNIIESAERAAGLSKNLMIFGNQQSFLKSRVNIKKLIIQCVEILKRTVNKKIVIETQLSATKTDLYGNESSLQSMIMNMGINAFQAMKEGGSFTIKTRNLSLKTEDALLESEMPDGEYLEIILSDTGTGIKPEDQLKIYDPYFTTKEKNHGTGLGLSAVYTTVKQHEGSIKVKSSFNKGTIFTILLPLNSVSS